MIIDPKLKISKKQLEELRKRPSPYSRRTEMQHTIIRALIKQSPATCRHLKGHGVSSIKPGPGAIKDFNVSMFTFATGETRIRCNACGFKWFRGDTRTEIWRNGLRKDNPTKLSWDDAVEMVNKSTNHPASSEIPSTVLNDLFQREASRRKRDSD